MRESTGTEKETEAKRFLKAREGRVATGQPILPRVDRIRYEEIAQDLRQHYETTGCRDLREARARFDHLARFFEGRRVAVIGSAEATTYVAKRQAEGAANATINRELSTLTRMLRLAYEAGKLLRLPVIRKLKEAAPRSGFFEQEAYGVVRRHLPVDPQVAQSSSPSGGAARARCSPSSSASSTWRPGPSGSIRAPPRTTRAGWCTCHQTSRPSSRRRSSACGRWSDERAASFLISSHT